MSSLSFRRHSRERSSKNRFGRAAEWIAALYIALVIATPVLIFEGPRVFPAFEQVSVAQLGHNGPVDAHAR